MKFALWFLACIHLTSLAEITPATFDVPAIRDLSTLETKVLQEWQPMRQIPGAKQKLIEITICEWWPGQKVRLPLTLCAPDSPRSCENVLVTNMGLGLKPALPAGAELEYSLNTESVS